MIHLDSNYVAHSLIKSITVKMGETERWVNDSWVCSTCKKRHEQRDKPVACSGFKEKIDKKQMREWKSIHKPESKNMRKKLKERFDLFHKEIAGKHGIELTDEQKEEDMEYLNRYDFDTFNEPDKDMKDYYDELENKYWVCNVNDASYDDLIDKCYFKGDGKSFMRKFYCTSTSFTFSPAHNVRIEGITIDKFDNSWLEIWSELSKK